MPSTYTLNNGIELIATGEQSGTWGDTTNTNMSLLDTALDGQVTVTLASAGTSGSPNTLPISDGAASNGRNRLVIFNDGADLGATAYVQLTPNDAEKIIYVRNNLSGSRSILFFQGTYNASNDYEVPAGTTAVIFFNGAGSGAVAANVFNNAYFDSLRLGSVSVTAILDEDNMASNSATALATQQSIKAYVDTQVGANNELSEVLANGNTTGGTDISVSSGDDITFADSSKAIFGAGSDLEIYHDGANSHIKDAGTGGLIIKGESSVQIRTSTANEAMLYLSQDGAVQAFYDNSLKFATTATGISVTGDAAFGDNGKAIFGAGSDLQIYHDASASYVSEQGVGPLNILASQLNIYNATETSQLAQFNTTSSKLFHNNSEKLATTASGVDVTGTVTADDAVYIEGSSPRVQLQDTDGTLQVSFLQQSGEDTILRLRNNTADGGFTVAGYGGASTTNRFYVQPNGDISFYDSVGSSQSFFWDASAERLGIGTTSPAEAISVAGDAIFENDTAVTIGYKGTSASSALKFRDRFLGADRMVISSAGNVGIGTDSPSDLLDISANGTSVMRLSDSSSPATYARITQANGVLTFAADAGNAQTGSNIQFEVDGSEAARIDASGNLLVSKTSSGIGTDGVELSSDGLTMITRSSDTPLLINRKTTEGKVVEFRKDNVAGGHIEIDEFGSPPYSYYLKISSPGDTTGLYFGLSDIYPMKNNTTADNAVNLGNTSFRYANIYISNSAYVGDVVFEGSTADANETTLAVADPTADRTITLPDQSGTVMLWGQALYGDPGVNNIAIGDNALASMGGGAQNNIAIGANALNSVTTGNANIAIGTDCAPAITTGTSNVSIGYDAHEALSSGFGNVAVGIGSSDTTTGGYNTHVGFNGGPDGSQANNNFQVCLGSYAYGLGDYSITIGYGAGDYHGGFYSDSTTTIAIGSQSCRKISGANYNVCVGTQVMASAGTAPTGDNNSIMGHYAGNDLLSGSNNVLVGARSGLDLTTSSDNVFVGSDVGRYTTTGSSHTFVGAYSGYASDASANYTGSNLVAIGYNAKPSAYTASNEITLGDSNIATLRCNVTTISSLSDERDKTDITDIGYGLDFIKAMRPVEFTWDRRDGTRNGVTDIGFIAQELAEVEYQFSSGSRTRLVHIHPDKFEADPMRTYPIMVKAMQEMAAKIEQLEARISQLEGA